MPSEQTSHSGAHTRPLTHALLGLGIEHALELRALLLGHEVDDELLRLEVLLHLHPHAVELQLLHPLVLLARLLEHRLLRLLLRELVPLELLHLRARRDRNVLTRR